VAVFPNALVGMTPIDVAALRLIDNSFLASEIEYLFSESA